MEDSIMQNRTMMNQKMLLLVIFCVYGTIKSMQQVIFCLVIKLQTALCQITEYGGDET